MQRALLVALLLAGCGADPAYVWHSAFSVGDSKLEILDRFGEPAIAAEHKKNDEPIWGAIETFWANVPVGSAVEIWRYDSEDPSMGKGQIELYFVDDSMQVNGIGFSPNGVVYESNSGD